MSQPTGLYGWIQSNDAKSAIFFLGFVIAVQVIAALALFIPVTMADTAHAPFFSWAGYAIRYAPWVLAASAIWFVSQMVWHIETVKRSVGFHFIDATDEPRLCRVIEPLIIMMGLPPPYVAVIESRAQNAFACGVARKKAAVVVTRGLLNSLNDEELACVLAHELSHIKNGDIRLMAAANIFMSALTRLHRNNGLRMTVAHALMSLLIPVILPLTLVGTFIGHLALRVGQVSRLLISSSREYIADAEAVQLTKNPAALASALVKVERNFLVETARREDDAMMIAGATEGGDATHPTVVQRIAALARTTGSMVFNAPSAPRRDGWTGSATLAEAEAAALLQKLPQARALPRVSAQAQENMLGLTRGGMLLTAATIAALLCIHYRDLGNPRALLAKFDIKPLSIMLGAEATCLAETWGRGAPCAKPTDDRIYRDMEGQWNTLVGWFADISRKRREAGVVNPDLTLRNMGEPSYVRRPYKGESGRLEGSNAEATDDGLYKTGRGSFSNVTPQSLVIAEINGVGCFSARLLHGNPKGRFRLDETPYGSSQSSLRRLIEVANGLVIPQGEAGTPAGDEWLRKYAGSRELTISVSYDLYGLPGLQRIREVYRADAHSRIVDLIRERLADPAFTAALDAIAAAKIAALARNPDHFVPCHAVKHGALEAG
jgi:Zn-dependent protease with chaperone function